MYSSLSKVNLGGTFTSNENIEKKELPIHSCRIQNQFNTGTKIIE